MNENFIARTGYTGEDGFELLAARRRRAGRVGEAARRRRRPCGLGARDTLRLEAGMNLYGTGHGRNRSRRSNAGLAWTVDLGAGRDFIGSRALERPGSARALLGLVLEDRGGSARAPDRHHGAR